MENRKVNDLNHQGHLLSVDEILGISFFTRLLSYRGY